jgi:hypothetical protein
MGGTGGTYVGTGYLWVAMTRLLVVLVFILAACGPRTLPPPTSRAEACARRLDPSVILRGFEVCEPTGNVARCGPNPSGGRDFVCGTGTVGAQTFCMVDYSAIGQPAPQFPYQSCMQGVSECPATWECVDYMKLDPSDPMGRRTFPETRWCFPPPPCSSQGDAGASDASSDAGTSDR